VKYILECCVDSLESAIEAKIGGANRIELCSNLIIGGTTPDLNLFHLVKEQVGLNTRVLIRPRYGDFCYSDSEFEIIKKNVEVFLQAGADGVVLGILTPDGSLDLERMEQLTEAAKGLPIALHRAFDMCKNPMEVLEQAKALGISTILTSGQRNRCIDGKGLIKELIKASNGQPEILVGGGVVPEVVPELIRDTNAKAFHLSGKVTVNSRMEYRKENVSMGLPWFNEYEILRTDNKKIEEVREILEKYMTDVERECCILSE
jgi:copper homeostasis protein